MFLKCLALTVHRCTMLVQFSSIHGDMLKKFILQQLIILLLPRTEIRSCGEFPTGFLQTTHKGYRIRIAQIGIPTPAVEWQTGNECNSGVELVGVIACGCTTLLEDPGRLVPQSSNIMMFQKNNKIRKQKVVPFCLK